MPLPGAHQLCFSSMALEKRLNLVAWRGSPHVMGKGTVDVCPSTWCHCKALGGIMAWKDTEG